MSKKSLIDTSILISFYNDGLFEEKLLQLNQKAELLFSSVSANEFVRGAHDPVSKGIVQSFLEIITDPEGQMITPTQSQWIECGILSELLLKQKRRSKTDVVLLQNDILIGLSARDAGAQVVTSDKKDFMLIKDLIKVSIDFWNA